MRTEINPNHEAHTSGVSLENFDYTNITSMEQFEDVRRRFVESMGWIVDAGSDYDIYDQPGAGSRYYVKRDQNESIEVGLRLTPVASLENSLSFNMVNESLVIKDEVERKADVRAMLQDAGQRGELWDLTRLVRNLDNKQSIEEVYAAIVEVVTTAIVDTALDAEDPVWVFATSADMRRSLTKIGVIHSVIAQDKLGQDTSTTYLCYTHPIDCLRHVQENPQDYAHTVLSVNNAFQAQLRDSNS